MKQKVVLILLAVVFLLLLTVGLALSILEGAEEPDSTGTTPGQMNPSTPGNAGETTPGETTPGETTPSETTPGPTTPPATEPVTTTPVVTQPGHVHSYTRKVTKPTLGVQGYTTYTCACGHSYTADKTPAVTLEQYVNGLSLNPVETGIPQLDQRVQSLLSTGTTTYDKLLAIHNFLLGCGESSAENSLSEMAAFAGDKVFQNLTELKFAFDANRMLTTQAGRDEHYAAAFTVAARALGLEAYVTSGTRSGQSCVWSSIRLDGKLYVFDAYGSRNVFGKLPQEAGYSEGYLSTYSGFQSAGEFTIKLQLQTGDGTSATQTYTWDVAKAGTDDDGFLRNTVELKAQGNVTYTITVTAGNGEVTLIDRNGMHQITGQFTDTLAPSGNSYILLVEEASSGRSFRITIDNKRA